MRNLKLVQPSSVFVFKVFGPLYLEVVPSKFSSNAYDIYRSDVQKQKKTRMYLNLDAYYLLDEIDKFKKFLLENISDDDAA